MKNDYTSVTELSGDLITTEQLLRMHNRYMWASSFSDNADVLEVACGTGPGLGLLDARSKTLTACDVDPQIISMAEKNYDEKLNLRCENVSTLSYPDASFDLIIIFEALYYLSDAELFFKEAFRALKPGGYLLICNANKDLDTFNPSPYSLEYHGVVELNNALSSLSFNCNFLGFLSIETVSLKQRLLGPIKKLAVRFNIMPKTMWGKKFLKRFVFGRLVPMPGRLTGGEFKYVEPTPISNNRPDFTHKVVYCCAQKPL